MCWVATLRIRVEQANSSSPAWKREREYGLTVTFKSIQPVTPDLWLFPISPSFYHFQKASHWRSSFQNMSVFGTPLIKTTVDGNGGVCCDSHSLWGLPVYQPGSWCSTHPIARHWASSSPWSLHQIRNKHGY